MKTSCKLSVLALSYVVTGRVCRGAQRVDIRPETRRDRAQTREASVFNAIQSHLGHLQLVEGE